MSGPALRLVDAALTDPGKIRTANEDALLAAPDRGLWAVADGMGGHDNGEWASRTVIEALGAAALSGDFDADRLRVADALHAANARVFSEAQAAGRRMGSTAVTLLVSGGAFAVHWVGDSRVYLWREGVLHQLTRDHTQVQEMVDRGLLSPAEAAGHPMSHVISRAIGVAAALEVEWTFDQARPGDIFMLCSDGLTGVVSDPEIADTLGSCRPRLACERLVARCLERGAPDNVTLIAIACDPLTLRIVPPPGATAS